MDKNRYQELKDAQKKVRAVLSQPDLSIEQRKEFERIAAGLAGQTFSIWLPIDWGRRILMALFALVGLYGLLTGNAILLAFWLFPTMMSPRLVGLFFYFLGTLQRKSNL